MAWDDFLRLIINETFIIFIYLGNGSSGGQEQYDVRDPIKDNNFSPPFEDETPYQFELPYHIVRVHDTLSVIACLMKGVNPTDLDVYVPRNGRSLVVSYEKPFPNAWWDVNKLFSEENIDVHG